MKDFSEFINFQLGKNFYYVIGRYEHVTSFNSMEAEKLQRLHDTLSKLIPRGKVGGLGFSSFNKQSGGKKRDDGLPDNGI